MTVLIFIVILVGLIVAHELGHFFVAKLSGMRVDEFGIGYPPRLAGWRYGETEYTLNALPFGGFVRIYGEDETATDSPRAFSARPRPLQAITLVAGILMNLLVAYIIISGMLTAGAPRALTPEEALRAPDAALVVASVLPGGPAETAGFAPGDKLLRIEGPSGIGYFNGAAGFSEAVANPVEDDGPRHFIVERNGVEHVITATPAAGVIAGDPDRRALGVSLATVGTLPVPWHEAPIEGAKLTWELTKQTAVGLVQFFGSVFTFSADLAQVSGPVGIAGVVGEAYDQGLTPLFTITALISINLALINLLPIPALDGGRLLFVIIESVIRRPIPTVFVRGVNLAGFAFLILLMVVITASDVFKILS
ncbi:MAG TPA: M50 family metallopeptidase [Candidatus Paceibacterota bacterium]|jgi:regulator of sigma E protease